MLIIDDEKESLVSYYTELRMGGSTVRRFHGIIMSILRYIKYTFRHTNSCRSEDKVYGLIDLC